MSKSKQLNFFIVSTDWKAINDFFKKMNILLIKVPVKKKEDLFNSQLAVIDESLYQIYLTTKDFRNEIFLKTENDGYGIDILKSCAIEFDKGGLYPYSNKILHRARFYTVTKFYDEKGMIISKNNDFVNWSDHVYKLFKKQFLKKSDIDETFSFSEAAIKWVRENNAEMDVAGLKIISSM